MSYPLMVAVWELDLTRPQTAVLQAMAEKADADGKRCFPSIDLVAYRTGYSTRRVIEIQREMREMKVLKKVAGARQHRPTEYEIHLEKAKRKLSFEQWRKQHGRHARDEVITAPLEESPEVQSPASGVQSPVPGVQSPVPGVQSRVSRGAVASSPYPVDPSDDSSYDPSEKVAVSSSPTHELVTTFFSYLKEVREKGDVPEEEQRPIPEDGPKSRGALAGQVENAAKDGDLEEIRKAVMRRAVRWDDYAMTLSQALGDVRAGKPWTIEQEQAGNGHSRSSAGRAGRAGGFAGVGARSPRSDSDYEGGY